ncbi:MAG: hypothetical protein ACYCY1_12870 [Sulfuriferula sp.]
MHQREHMVGEAGRIGIVFFDPEDRTRGNESGMDTRQDALYGMRFGPVCCIKGAFCNDRTAGTPPLKNIFGPWCNFCSFVDLDQDCLVWMG